MKIPRITVDKIEFETDEKWVRLIKVLPVHCQVLKMTIWNLSPLINRTDHSLLDLDFYSIKLCIRWHFLLALLPVHLNKNWDGRLYSVKFDACRKVVWINLRMFFLIGEMTAFINSFHPVRDKIRTSPEPYPFYTVTHWFLDVTTVFCNSLWSKLLTPTPQTFQSTELIVQWLTHSMQINTHPSEILARGCLANHFHRESAIKQLGEKKSNFKQWTEFTPKKIVKMNANLCVQVAGEIIFHFECGFRHNSNYCWVHSFYFYLSSSQIVIIRLFSQKK